MLIIIAKGAETTIVRNVQSGSRYTVEQDKQLCNNGQDFLSVLGRLIVESFTDPIA